MTINVNREKDLKKLADELKADVNSFKARYDGMLSWKNVKTIQDAEKVLEKYNPPVCDVCVSDNLKVKFVSNGPDDNDKAAQCLDCGFTSRY